MQPTPVLQRAIRRLALTTKQGPHNFYKGNRTGAMGQHTKYGGYRIDWKKVRTYVCPDLREFSVRTPSAEEKSRLEDRYGGRYGVVNANVCTVDAICRTTHRAETR